MQDPPSSSDKAEARPVARRSSLWANLALLVVSLLLSLGLVEIGYRMIAGMPVFSWTNWRIQQVQLVRFQTARFVSDPVLGWTNLPWLGTEGFETIDYGIRRNFKETTVRTGGVLAVGASFTEGWDVVGHETWPAWLEDMNGIPVVNAGIGGYATDQIVLRAEQLLPIVKPKILIVGVVQDNIIWSRYSVNSAPKPYFTIENGELRYHPPGPMEPRRTGGLMTSAIYSLRQGLGYFAIADYLLGRLTPQYWIGTESEMFEQRPEVNVVAVTCALLRRLKARADKDGIHTALFFQYIAQSLLQVNGPSRETRFVMECARQAGIRVVDQLPALRKVVASGRNALKKYYIYDQREYWHMTANGNRHAANLLSTQLQDWLQPPPASTGE